MQQKQKWLVGRLEAVSTGFRWRELRCGIACAEVVAERDDGMRLNDFALRAPLRFEALEKHRTNPAHLLAVVDIWCTAPIRKIRYCMTVCIVPTQLLS